MAVFLLIGKTSALTVRGAAHATALLTVWRLCAGACIACACVGRVQVLPAGAAPVPPAARPAPCAARRTRGGASPHAAWPLLACARR